MSKTILKDGMIHLVDDKHDTPIEKIDEQKISEVDTPDTNQNGLKAFGLSILNFLKK